MGKDSHEQSFHCNHRLWSGQPAQRLLRTEKIGADPIITNDEKTILEAPRVILPGVGAFGDCMDHLAASGLEDAIFRIVEKGTPFLGICVGLQLLFEGSEETPGVKGLGIFKGRVRLIRTPYKIPHMGWNELTITGRHLC